MPTEFDELVLDAIRGHSRERPQGLTGILEAVDARMKLVLSHEELSSSLGRLIAAGKLCEGPRHRFFEPASPTDRSVFSGLTPEEHRKACDEYRKEFWQKYRELSGK